MSTTKYSFEARALRLERRGRLVSSRLKDYTMGPSGPLNRETEETHEDLGWFLTIETNGPPVSFNLGSKKPSLPLTLEIKVFE